MAKQFSNAKFILKERFKKLKNSFEFPRLYLCDHFAELKRKVDMAYVKLEISTKDASKKEAIINNLSETIKKISSYESDCLRFQKTNQFGEDVQLKIKNSFQLIEDKLKDFDSDVVKAKFLRYYDDDEGDEKYDVSEDEDDGDDDDKNGIYRYQIEEFQELSDLIYDTLNELARIFFLNKTIFFLEKKKIRIISDYYVNIYPEAHSHVNIDLFKFLDETTAGILVLLKNKYCGIRATSIPKRLVLLKNVIFSNNKKIILRYAFLNQRITKEIIYCKMLKREMEKNEPRNFFYETNLNLDHCDLSRSAYEICVLDNFANTPIKIDLNAFNNSKHLTSLSLNYNYLNSLQPNFFLSLVNVIQLDLCSCNLHSLKVGTFNGLVNCKELLIMNNWFDSLENDVFAGLTNVEQIRLNCCHSLRRVRGNAFRGLDKLNKIDMGHCNLNSIALDEFKSLKSLKCLVISTQGYIQGNINLDFVKKANQSKKYSFDIS